jgi:hypothetical protein
MNIEKIEIKPNQYVWVDKDVEATPDDIKEGKGRYYKNEDIMCKIIAASPELHLKGVPTYVEWLAKDYANNSAVTNYEEGINVGKYQGFIKGYQTAEKELFTEEEVREVFHVGRLYQGREGDTTLEQILEQLKQEKKNFKSQ